MQRRAGFYVRGGLHSVAELSTDRCPTGVATQDQDRQRALVVPSKAERVRSYHTETLKALAEFVAAAGLSHPREFTLAHFSRRISSHEVRDLADSYPALEPGALLAGVQDHRFKDAWAMADPESSGQERSPNTGGGLGRRRNRRCAAVNSCPEARPSGYFA